MSRSILNQEANIAKIIIENEVQKTESENLDKKKDTFGDESDIKECLRIKPSKYSMAKIVHIESELECTERDNLGKADDTLKIIQSSDGEGLKLQPPQGRNLVKTLTKTNIAVDDKDHVGDSPQIALPPYWSRNHTPLRSPIMTPTRSQRLSFERFIGLTRYYDPRARNSLVALLMSVVFIMLLATAGFISIVLTSPVLKTFFEEAGWLTILPAIAGLAGANYAMMCSPCARRPPLNIVILSVGTTCVSIIAAKVSTHYRTEIIMYAVLATGAVVFVCLLIACSKIDFTSWMMYVV